MNNTDTIIIDRPLHSVPLPEAQNKQVPKPTWLGRENYYIEPKSSPFSLAFQGVIAAILVVVGAVIASAHPVLGGCLIVAGALLGIHVIKKIMDPDQLEEVVKYLANTEDLDALPQIAWGFKTTYNIDKKRSELADHITTWKPSDMSHDIMALKEDGKTIAVAFKMRITVETDSFSAKPDSELSLEEHYVEIVKVIALKSHLEPFTLYQQNGIPNFSVSDVLFLRDVEQYATYFKRPQADEMRKARLKADEDTAILTDRINQWTNQMKEKAEDLKNLRTGEDAS